MSYMSYCTIFIHLLSSGDYDDDLSFTYDENTEVSRSCSASLNDRMLVFGGWHQRRQVYINQIFLILFSTKQNTIRLIRILSFLKYQFKTFFGIPNE